MTVLPSIEELKKTRGGHLFGLLADIARDEADYIRQRQELNIKLGYAAWNDHYILLHAGQCAIATLFDLWKLEGEASAKKGERPNPLILRSAKAVRDAIIVEIETLRAELSNDAT